MIAIYPLRRALWQELFDRTTDDDVAEFNRDYDLTYTREELAYVAPTLMRIDDMLTSYYGRAIPFRTRFLNVTWSEETVLVQVEVIYQPITIPN